MGGLKHPYWASGAHWRTMRVKLNSGARLLLIFGLPAAGCEVDGHQIHCRTIGNIASNHLREPLSAFQHVLLVDAREQIAEAQIVSDEVLELSWLDIDDLDAAILQVTDERPPWAMPQLSIFDRILGRFRF